MRKRLFKLIHRDLKKITMTDLSGKIGLPVVTLWKIVKGQRQGSIQTWEKIERYYR